MTTPEPAAPKPTITQLSVGLAETADGQQVALTMTMLLSVADAKTFAAQLTGLTDQLSSSRLVVAAPRLNGGVSG